MFLTAYFGLGRRTLMTAYVSTAAITEATSVRRAKDLGVPDRVLDRVHCAGFLAWREIDPGGVRSCKPRKSRAAL